MIAWLWNLLFGKPKGTLVCVRQANTFCWPDHLGKKTEGNCDKCGEPIYFEKQNRYFHKICYVCAL